MATIQAAAQLKQVPLLSGLDGKQLNLLAFTCEVFEYAAGDALFRRGENSDCVYVILQGTVEVLGGDGREVLLATLGKNNLIGEMAVLNDAPRTATVRARDAVSALKIPNERFLELITANPQAALQVMQMLSEKLADTSRRAAALQAQLDQQNSPA